MVPGFDGPQDTSDETEVANRRLREALVAAVDLSALETGVGWKDAAAEMAAFLVDAHRLATTDPSPDAATLEWTLSFALWFAEGLQPADVATFDALMQGARGLRALEGDTARSVWLELLIAEIQFDVFGSEHALASLARARVDFAESPYTEPVTRALSGEILRVGGEYRRAHGELHRAWTCIRAWGPQLEEGLRGRLCVARVAGALAHLSIAQGVNELAARWIQEERAAVEALDAMDAQDWAPGEDPLDAWLPWQARYAEYCLVAMRHRELIEADAHMRKNDPRSVELGLDWELRVLVARAHLELRDPPPESEARAALEALARDPWATPLQRLQALELVVFLSISRGDAQRVEQDLGRFAEGIATLPDGSSAERGLFGLSLATARVRWFLEHGGPHESGRGAYEDLSSRFEAWCNARSQEAVLEGGEGLLLHGTQRLALITLMRAAAALPELGPRVAFDHYVRSQGLASMHRRMGLPTPTLEEVRLRLCGSDGGVLAFVAAYLDAVVLVLDGDTLQVLPIAGRDRIEFHGAGLRTSLGRGGRVLAQAEFDRHASGLLDCLLPGELAERVGAWKRLHVSGLDLCGHPPVERLPLGASGLPLGARIAVSRLPTLSIGVALAEAPPRTIEGAALTLMIAESPEASHGVEGRPLPALPLEPGHLDLLEGPFAGSVDRRTGAQANLASLREARVATSGILHLLCHGVHDWGSAQPAHLVLHGSTREEAWVSCREASELEVPSTVLLSACGSARGFPRAGDDGVGHLGGSFLMAGAQCVILSEEDLEFEAAVAYSSAIQRELCRGAAPAEAVRRVRSAAHAEGDSGAMAFRVLGYGGASPLGSWTGTAFDPDATPGRGRSRSAAWIAIASLVALAGWLWGVRRTRS